MKQSLMLGIGRRASLASYHSPLLRLRFSSGVYYLFIYYVVCSYPLVAGVPEKKPANYWGDSVHQKEFLEKLGATLGFKSYEDWYFLF